MAKPFHYVSEFVGGPKDGDVVTSHLDALYPRLKFPAASSVAASMLPESCDLASSALFHCHEYVLASKVQLEVHGAIYATYRYNGVV